MSGTGSFQNAHAAAWLAELDEGNTLDKSCAAISRAIDGGSQADIATWQEAIAAVEVVSALLGRPGAAVDAPALALSWLPHVPAQPDPALVLRALQVVDQLTFPCNPLLQLWQSQPEFVQWRSNVAELRTRLQG